MKASGLRKSRKMCIEAVRQSRARKTRRKSNRCHRKEREGFYAERSGDKV
ncbi:hypothetical protein CLOLEP_02229 [[Clostridium] leptum DSM 753]|uniref:Uncharacterized protein n=1 Tax=[Clostridium] leptum DSM 753 TaxID=428125 RepID=A7VUI3_9FIRM|nr:hypothetical protein CLOLEP_02229 [[Clostridium] leptum DSM 753]